MRSMDIMANEKEHLRLRALDLIDGMKNAGFQGTFKTNADIDGVTYDVVWEKSEIARFGIGFYWHGGDDYIHWKVCYNGVDEYEENEDLLTDTNDKLIEVLKDYNDDNYIVAWTGLFGRKHATWIPYAKPEKYDNKRKYTVYKF